MFIKIIDQKVVKERNENGLCVKEILNTIEHNYEVSNYSLFPSLPTSEEKNREMNVALQFIDGNKGWDKTFTYPVDSEDQVVEIYVMNNQGRTMERYIY